MENSNKNELSVAMVIISVIILFSFYAYTSNNKDNSQIQKKEKTKITKVMEKTIKFSANLDNRYYYNNSEVYLNLDLRAEESEGKIERTPLNMSVVLDKSGSMSSKNKLDFVKKAVEHIIDELSYDDYFSLVTYDDNVSVVYFSSQVEDKTLLKNEVRRIVSGGFTNLSGGMNEGYRQVEKTIKRGYVNRVLLLSDGLANRGITDRFELRNIPKNKSSNEGITISTFGVGNDFNENLMADIANYGKGNYYYIKNSDDIPEIFANELRGVRVLAAQDTRIRIKFPSDYLEIKNVFGYHYEVQGDEITISLKDVFAGQRKNIMVKFNIKKKINSRLEFESYLTYDDARADLVKVEEKIITTLEPARTKVEFDDGLNVTVKQNVVTFEANEIMELALQDADNGNYEEARAKMKKGKEYLDEQNNAIPQSAEMKEQYDNMEKYDKDLTGAETKSEESRKEMQKEGKYDNYKTRQK